MKTKRITAPLLSADERKRIAAIRAKFRGRPSPDELLHSGDYDGPFEAETEWPVRLLVGELRSMREEAGIQQKDLARRIGMDPTALCRIEAGRVENLTLQTLGRIARGLGCTLKLKVDRLAAPARNAVKRSGRKPAEPPARHAAVA